MKGLRKVYKVEPTKAEGIGTAAEFEVQKKNMVTWSSGALG